MKVLFQTRINLFKAPGGDTIQILKTKEYLEKKGFEVDISLDFEPNLAEYDIVHLFNLMEPQDIYRQMVNAKKQNKKIVLSTIYGLYTEFERNARGGLFQKLANLLNPYQIQYIRLIIKHFYEKRFHKGIYQMIWKGYYNMLKEIAKNTDVFLPNSVSEMRRIENELKLKNYNFISIPNSIDKSIFNDDLPSEKYSQYKDCILCAARIEGRKSTLNLVKAVKDTKYKLVLVGNESKNQKKYVEEVHKQAGENVYFLGAISHNDLKDLYKVAKVHVLASWMETPGLSSLEAAVMGCNIVVTEKGDTFEYFEDYAFYCDPNDYKSIRSAIDIAFNTPVNQKLKEKILNNYTWEKTVEETIKAYQLAMKKK
ncbi:MAG: glycosyltransferase [Flavobacterium sp.]